MPSAEHQTKHDIRNAARRLFAERGYNAVSMRDIAERIGRHQGGLYNHIPGKQAILVDLMRENLTRAHAAGLSVLNTAAPPAERLEGFVRGHVGHNIANPDDIFIAYMELRSLEPEGAETVKAQRDAYENGLRAILSDGQKSGRFAIIDAAIHARTILAMLAGVTVWYRESGGQSPAEITECYVLAVLQSVGVPYLATHAAKG